MILVRASGAGIKREGLLYFEKYGTGGPEFGIKEELVTERGRQLFHARAISCFYAVKAQIIWSYYHLSSEDPPPPPPPPKKKEESLARLARDRQCRYRSWLVNLGDQVERAVHKVRCLH